jgi:hypothetical protein
MLILRLGLLKRGKNNWGAVSNQTAPQNSEEKFTAGHFLRRYLFYLSERRHPERVERCSQRLLRHAQDARFSSTGYVVISQTDQVVPIARPVPLAAKAETRRPDKINGIEAPAGNGPPVSGSIEPSVSPVHSLTQMPTQ